MLNKNLLIIFLSSTIASFAPVVTVLLSGIIGSQLIETNWASTMPMSLMICGTFIFAPIASSLFRLIGRKKGFMLASLMSSFAAIICSYSITISNFYIFCFGCLLIGSAHAFVHQYRFTIPENVGEKFVPRAMSYILLLGIVSALLASNFASYFKNLTAIEFTGSFLFLSITALIPIIFLFFYNDEKIIIEKSKFEFDKISSILKNPKIILSIVCGGVGYYVMASIMTASSLFLHIMKEFTIFETSIVIQLHIVAMFLPSLFTGDLIKKFGHNIIIISGIILLFLSISSNIFYQTYIGYALGLILLGVGWNFTFVCSSSLLVISYEKKDKFVAQGTADFIVFATQATGSLTAGILLYTTSWEFLNLMCIPLLLIVLLTIYFTNNIEKKIET